MTGFDPGHPLQLRLSQFSNLNFITALQWALQGLRDWLLEWRQLWKQFAKACPRGWNPLIQPNKLPGLKFNSCSSCKHAKHVCMSFASRFAGIMYVQALCVALRLFCTHLADLKKVHFQACLALKVSCSLYYHAAVSGFGGGVIGGACWLRDPSGRVCWCKKWHLWASAAVFLPFFCSWIWASLIFIVQLISGQLLACLDFGKNNLVHGSVLHTINSSSHHSCWK